jgi:spore coat protein U-like protein
MLKRVRILIGLLWVFVCQATMAGTATGALLVTATVCGSGPGGPGGGGGPCGSQSCSLGEVRNMIFPSYSPLNANPDTATGAVTVNCTANLSYDIGINQGLAVGATEEHRMVTKVGGKQVLNYALFQDANHLHPYGTILGQNTLHQVGTGSAQVITIYGEIPINQLVEVGSYSDTVTILVTF